jgi:hypothetical protein
MNKNIILLTATITPPQNAAQLRRIDPLVRLQDYEKAFEFYLKKIKQGVIFSIVFSDNSNSDLKTLRNLVNKYDLLKQVEFISFEGLDYPPAYGRGYGEFKMLDYVMSNSRLIRDADPTSNVWKITGRYILENIEGVIRTKPLLAQFYCNYRNIPRYWVDLYVLCWSRNYYEQCIKGVYLELREDAGGGSAEQAFRRKMESKKSTLLVTNRFATVPLLQGYRGLDNKNYKEMGFKLFLRRFALIVMPWLWV